MGSRSDIARPIVLLVEDDRAIAEMMSDLLDAEGFEVLAVRAGEEAVGLALGGAAIDLVFTDIDLAGKMSGWELGEVLGNMRPDVPIAYTSGGLIIDPEACMRRAGPFVSKPYKLATVCELLNDLLASRVVAAAPSLVPAAKHWLEGASHPA
jgi:CheY-like chemotaxis protein